MLSIVALAKTLPGGRALFRSVALTVNSGELVAIVGESGVGKSTLLNILAGLDQPDSGSVFVGEREVTSLAERDRTKLRREQMGFVFQAFHILPYLTLWQNVALPLALISGDRRQMRTRANEMLDNVGLAGRGSDYARDLSGGELQRVAIARALVHRPSIIFADEPTGNLDPDTATKIIELFANAVHTGGATAVLATHSNAIAAIADRTLTLTQNGLNPSREA